ncbi:unnamed protein product [Toxocara canis]|uniref:Transmembrane protein 170A n=1 Tax=Toxocara canis TaxID=6265 RepID=A0A183UIF3_TOXCA|nr:unnamed protein product [Toxocara canis]
MVKAMGQGRDQGRRRVRLGLMSEASLPDKPELRSGGVVTLVGVFDCERSSFSLWEVLTLESEDMVSFWEMWLGITVWMTVSYAFVYFLAAAVSTLMLRKHPWMLAITIPMLAMSVICPATLGALTSATIALTFSSADKAISCSHCMALGCAQTFFAVIIGFSRILATL